MRSRLRSALLVLGIFALAGCGSDDDQFSALTDSDAQSADDTAAATTEPSDSNPLDEFRIAVCGSAPAASLSSILPGATFSDEWSTFGSWFGDGLGCQWQAPSGEFILATIYIAPEHDWRDRPPEFELLHDLDGIPLTLSVGTPSGDSFSMATPTGDPAALVQHIDAALAEHLPALCEYPITQIFGTLQQRREDGYASVCATHNVAPSVEQVMTADAAEVLALAFEALEQGDRAAFEALLTPEERERTAAFDLPPYLQGLPAVEQYQCEAYSDTGTSCWSRESSVVFNLEDSGDGWQIASYLDESEI